MFGASMRIKLIGNPVSGGDARPRIQAALGTLRDLGCEVDLCMTAARGDARQAASLAVSEGYDRVVAAGGDGTLNEVVNGVASPDLPIGFLPLGTVNVFALEAGIPLQIEKACAVAVQGAPRAITLGKINGELFLLMASAGWDAAAVAHVRPGLKKLLGRMAYAVSAVETLLFRPPSALHLQLPDGRCLKGFGVVVSNCRFYGGRYVVTPAASMFKNDLEVCLLCQGSRAALLRFALSLALKRPLHAPLAEFLTVDELSLKGDGVPIQVDGDDFGSLPVLIKVVPRAVTMVLPGDSFSERAVDVDS
jgi:YegS/Rv2252/BmrU family lipid kinase